MSSTITTIDLIRHGEPVGGKRIRGQIDDPLSEKGWQQMRGSVGDANPWQAIVSSPLRRCAEFAEELAQRHNVTVNFDERLKEIRWGDWEGFTPAELTKDDPDSLMRYWSDPTNNLPPGAELVSDFRNRIVAAWVDLLEKHFGKHVLLVGHAGVTRAVMCHTLNTPIEHMFQIQVKNAGITRIEIEHKNNYVLHRLIQHNGSM